MPDDDDDEHQPLEPEYASFMKDLAMALDELVRNKFGDDTGFALLMFKTGTATGRMNYLSSASRVDMVKVLKEFTAKAEMSLKSGDIH